MVNRSRHLLLCLGVLLIAACDPFGISTDEEIDRQIVRISIRPAAELSIATWRQTRWIGVDYRTSQGRKVLDTLVPASPGATVLPPLSMVFGAVLDVTGRDSLDAVLWTAATRFAAEPEPTASTRAIELIARTPASPPFRTGIADTPTLHVVPQGDSLLVELRSSQAVAIHYSLDGSNPTAFSARFSTPFPIAPRTRIRVIALGDTLYPSKILDTTLPAGVP